MGISWAALLLLILTGWTLLGALGVSLSLMRQERAKARHDLAWIFGIWALYMVVLLMISLTARPRPVALGQDQCFGSVCVAVIRTETVPGYLAKPGERVLRVSLRISNHSRKREQGDEHLGVYLVDSLHRRWEATPGLEGVRLSTTLDPGDSVVSQPIFKVTSDANRLRLVLTRGRGLPYALILGDRDSLLHPAVVVPLEH